MIRAFIVDDEEPARERLRRLLKEVAGGSGVERALEIVGEASDGSEAVPEIARLSPDLVFLDIQMPGLSGLEVAARLSPPRPRIVFCTAFDEFAIHAFEHHAVDYLLKPVNTARLSRTVERVSSEIEKQRRLTSEQNEAVRTQARLMPTAAALIAGLECAGTCKPASGIGGDYYDFLTLDENRAALTLGDVSGKGTFAGLLVAALQGRLQALAASGIRHPRRLLMDLNALTVGTMEANRFATVFFAIYDRDQRALTYASAGHPPAVIVGPGGTRELAPTGPAVGWSVDTAIEDVGVSVGPGDVLAVVSDGITETLNTAGELFGTDRLADAVSAASHLAAADIVERVMTEIDRFSGGAPAEDDRTLLIARVG
jgi:serine phosphatase RsbU (regulator of sigma subunit)